MPEERRRQYAVGSDCFRRCANGLRVLPWFCVSSVILWCPWSHLAFAEPPGDTHPPTVRITAPADGQYVSGAIELAINASDDRGVTHVTVYKDGVLMGSDTDPPFRMTWDTRLDTEGPHILLARARDADWNEGVSSAVRVVVDNTPPTVALVAPRDGSALNRTVRLEAEASDAIGIEEVQFLLDGKIVGSATSPPYTVSWNSQDAPNGSYALQARAVDGAKHSVSSTLATVRVVNLNHPPVLDPIGSKTVVEGSALTFVIQGVDSDGDREPLTYSASTLPPWATFTPLTGEFRGTPTYQEATLTAPTRVYAGMVFTVCDPEPLCAREEITITVLNVNRPPEMEQMENVVVNEGVFMTLPLIARDPDGDLLTCTAGSLPPWASFDASTCSVKGLPDFSVASQAKPEEVSPTVRFEICDPAPLCVDRVIAITVSNVNRPPVWEAIGHQTVDEDRPLRFKVRAGDPDQDSLLLVASSLPTGSTFTDEGAGHGTFAWTPRADQAGSYEVVFSVSDGAASDHGLVRITVRQTSLAISGTVASGLNDPVEGVTVQIRKVSKTVQEITTDAQGFYLVKDLPAGKYTVTPRYQLDRPFSSAPRKLEAVSFEPRYHVVTLTDRDQSGVDFTIVLP